MKVEARLKRTFSRKLAEQQAKANTHFPSVWNSQCLAYSNLKWLLTDSNTCKTGSSQKGGTDDAAKVDWEHSFSTILEAEINKISSFYDERLDECLEGLKAISSEISNVCTIKSVESLQTWHEFIIQYSTKAKTIETREETPHHFMSTMEGYLLSLADKQIEQALLGIFKKLVYIHKLSLHLKSFAQFNVNAIKKILKKHDKHATKSISTEWIERIRSENFSNYDSFEKIVAQTKALVLALTPSSEDFACPICLGLLYEPVVIQCGHRFCEQCLIVASTSCNFCPMCRTEQQLHPSNHALDKHLKQYLKHYFASEYKRSLHEHKIAKKKGKHCIIS
jgi:hypothetical protein